MGQSEQYQNDFNYHQNERAIQASFYEKYYLQNHPTKDTEIKVAFEAFLDSQNEVKKLLSQFSVKEGPVAKIAEYLAHLFSNDSYVQ